jgi:glycosyltransferase involved in cell wall biosynthesis
MNPVDHVTVVTITRRRPGFLERALTSVETQEYVGTIKHLVIIDGCADTLGMLRERRKAVGVALSIVYAERDSTDRDGPARLARLRNLSLDRLESRWVCFLDDDNTYAPNHLQSLSDTAVVSGCLAVHSQRRIYYRDGRPYLEPRFAWTRDAEAGRILYADGVRRGVFEEGSNVVRDQVDVDHKRGGARIVDMNAWLLDVELLREVRFHERYDHRDWLYLVAEDTKLLRDLVSRQVPMACTGLATLNYFLGGYSNNFGDADHEWREEPAERDAIDLEAMRVFPPSWRRGEA